MTPWVKRLLIANAGVFLLQMAYPELTTMLGSSPAATSKLNLRVSGPASG